MREKEQALQFHRQRFGEVGLHPGQIKKCLLIRWVFCRQLNANRQRLVQRLKGAIVVARRRQGFAVVELRPRQRAPGAGVGRVGGRQRLQQGDRPAVAVQPFRSIRPRTNRSSRDVSH